MPRIDSDSPMTTRVTRRAVMRGMLCTLATATGLALGLSALAADEPRAAQPTKGQSMKPDEPMSGEMRKKGMKKGGVKEAAEKKEREMKDILEKEEKSMPPSPTEK